MSEKRVLEDGEIEELVVSPKKRVCDSRATCTFVPALDLLSKQLAPPGELFELNLLRKQLWK
jgi:hypothetical protein